MKISVIMANYRGARFLDAAIASVLRQTWQDFELVIGDDASDDGSVEIVRRWQNQDPRIRLLTMDRNRGAAASRNRCLDAAQGDWIAIMDSDDVLHPDRLHRMQAVAMARSATFVADDMLFFSDTPEGAGRTLLQDLSLTAPLPLSALDMLSSDVPGNSLPPLGYLKPMIAREAVGSLRYDESLPVSEDFDFYLRVLIAGANAVILPEPMYGYRRHSRSLSHRLSVPIVERMIAAQCAFSGEAPLDLSAAFDQRAAGLRRKLAYEKLVAAIKEPRVGTIAFQLLKRPTLLRELVQSLFERLARRRKRVVAKSPLSLCLGAEDESCEVSIPFPAVPSSGKEWTEPVADIAAYLSSLAAEHHLSIQAHGNNGLWALWLVPQWEKAEVQYLTDPYLPLPE